MSRVKLVPDLFLGIPEFEKLIASLKDRGYKEALRGLTLTYGVAVTPEQPLSLKITPGEDGHISILPGLAVDKNLNCITVQSTLVNHIAIPSNGDEHFIYIRYEETHREKGTVSIYPDGTVVGVPSIPGAIPTEFTKLFRGEGSRLPSKISFVPSELNPGPILNQGEYEVNTVLDDSSLVLNVVEGVLAEEYDVGFRVVGTFTPGVTPDAGNKYPFVNDSFYIWATDTEILNPGEYGYYLLGSAVNDDGVVTTRDLRNKNLFSATDTEATQENFVIGVESIKYGSSQSTGIDNTIQIGWGLEAPTGAWSVNSSGILVVGSVKGGIIQEMSDITDFTKLRGWRVVFPDGTVGKVIISSFQLGELRLQTTFTSNSLAGPLYIVPDCDDVEINILSPTNSTVAKRVSFDANMRYGLVQVESNTTVQIRYRLLKGGTKNSPIKLINPGIYIPESSFDDNGNIISADRETYTNGTVEIQRKGTTIITILSQIIPIGGIIEWAGLPAQVPVNYVICDGSQINQPLSPLHGSFTPDFRGKVSVGFHFEDNDFNEVKATGGAKTHKLIESEMPSHKHDVQTQSAGNHEHLMFGGSYGGGNGNQGISNNSYVSVRGDSQGSYHRYQLTGVQTAPWGGKSSNTGAHTHSVSEQNKGNNQPHNNLQPYIVVYKIMRIL